MNCYNHSNEVAVATCIDCGKGLCDECARMYTIPICNACNFIRIKVEKSSILKRWGISLGIAILLTILFCTNGGDKEFSTDNITIKMLYLFVGIPYGWRALNVITPKFSLILPVYWAFIACILYFFIKGIISSIIGFFILPFKLFKEIKRYIEINRTLRFMRS
jgi:putative membrane protein